MSGKNDYGTGGVFYGLFLAPKIKYVSTINEFGINQQHMTFKGFNDSKRLLDRSQYFDMLEDKQISAKLPRSWKESFNTGIIIPIKTRRCDKSNEKILCDECNNQGNQNKNFEANLNLIKRDVLKQFGHMFFYYNRFRLQNFLVN